MPNIKCCVVPDNFKFEHSCSNSYLFFNHKYSPIKGHTFTINGCITLQVESVDADDILKCIIINIDESMKIDIGDNKSGDIVYVKIK